MVNGSCCLKIFSKSNYRGMFEVLLPGSDGGYKITKIRSFRFLECENQYFTSTTLSTTTLTTTTTKSTTLDHPSLYTCTKDAEFFNESKIMSNRKRYRKKIVRISVFGTCCLRIFQKSHFRGRHQKLQPGFNGSHELSSIKSLRFEEC